MYCNTKNYVNTILFGTAKLYLKTTVCNVAINFLEITLILEPDLSDVKIGPTVHTEIG